MPSLLEAPRSVCVLCDDLVCVPHLDVSSEEVWEVGGGEAAAAAAAAAAWGQRGRGGRRADMRRRWSRPSSGRKRVSVHKKVSNQI